MCMVKTKEKTFGLLTFIIVLLICLSSVKLHLHVFALTLCLFSRWGVIYKYNIYMNIYTPWLKSGTKVYVAKTNFCIILIDQRTCLAMISSSYSFL